MSSNELFDMLKPLYDEYDIMSEFYESTDGKKAFIDRNYGWAYTINPSCTFHGLCECIKRKDYKDFKLMSEYSHGTSIYLKISTSMFMENMYTVLSCIYTELYRMVVIYCLEDVGNDFHKIMDKLEDAVSSSLDI